MSNPAAAIRGSGTVEAARNQFSLAARTSPPWIGDGTIGCVAVVASDRLVIITTVIDGHIGYFVQGHSQRPDEDDLGYRVDNWSEVVEASVFAAGGELRVFGTTEGENLAFNGEGWYRVRISSRNREVDNQATADIAREQYRFDLWPIPEYADPQLIHGYPKLTTTRPLEDLTPDELMRVLGYLTNPFAEHAVFEDPGDEPQALLFDPTVEFLHETYTEPATSSVWGGGVVNPSYHFFTLDTHESASQDGSFGDITDDWIGVSETGITVFTNVYGGHVAFITRGHKSAPRAALDVDDLSSWEHAVEASIYTETEIHVAGWGGGSYDPTNLAFTGPGWYRVRISARGRDHDNEYDASPDLAKEQYRIDVWPATDREPTVSLA